MMGVATRGSLLVWMSRIDNKKHATETGARLLALALLTEREDTGMHNDGEKARGPPR